MTCTSQDEVLNQKKANSLHFTQKRGKPNFCVLIRQMQKVMRHLDGINARKVKCPSPTVLNRHLLSKGNTSRTPRPVLKMSAETCP